MVSRDVTLNAETALVHPFYPVVTRFGIPFTLADSIYELVLGWSAEL